MPGVMEQEADPFEEHPASSPAPLPVAPMVAGVPIAPLREDIVQQATRFLQDPRVRAADARRAVDFLIGKKVTEQEVREAFRREGLPFPEALPQSEKAVRTLYEPPSRPGLALTPRRRRSATWVSVFWGVTTALGALAGVRELLRRYVFPTYFPGLMYLVDGAGQAGRGCDEAPASPQIGKTTRWPCAPPSMCATRAIRTTRVSSQAIAVRMLTV